MQKEFPPKVGEKIKAIRKEKRLTQADFSKNGISPAYLSLIENGHRRPTPVALNKIAKILGVDLSEIQETTNDQLSPELRELAFTVQISIDNNRLKLAQQLLDQFPVSTRSSTEYLLLLASMDCELGNYLASYENLNTLISDHFKFATLSQRMRIVTLFGETTDKTDLGLIAIVQLMRIQGDYAAAPKELKVLIACLLAARLADSGFSSDAIQQLALASDLLGSQASPDLIRNLYWTASNIALDEEDFLEASELVKSAIRTLPDGGNSLNNLQISLLEINLNSPNVSQGDLISGLHNIRTYLSTAQSTGYFSKLAILEVGYLAKLHHFDEALSAAAHALTLENMPGPEFTDLQLLVAEVEHALGNTDKCLTECMKVAISLKAQPRNRRNLSKWLRLKRIALAIKDSELLTRVTILELDHESQFDNFTDNLL